MARGTPTYFSGDIDGGNAVQDLYSAIIAYFENGATPYQSGGVDAWDEYDPVVTTAGSRRYIYRSLGDRSLATGAGDAGLFIEMLETSTYIDFKAYQDWSTASSGSGSRVAFSSTYSRWSGDAATSIRYWGVVNEYEFAMVTIQGGTFRYIHFGSPERTHIPEDGDGICFTTGSATAGSSVVLNVDRDVSTDGLSGKISVGQKVWIYNQTAAAAALEDDTVDVATVTAVSASTITIDTLSNNKASGAIVGLDPCPMFASSYSANPVLYFTNWSDGTTTVNGTSHSYVAPISILTEGNLDPSANSLYYGCRLLVNSTDATKGGVRGTCELVSNWSKGVQADADRMLADYAGSAANAWKVFPSLNIPASTFSFGIGPGASS